ncbi:MAG: hypothetical protein CVU44_08365 [Chloroflexi bacterium HGW-Chloroflexi-6]|nr:MAG: hypothetical protein CVU44_08365 [Chloroflexi bacterium HGW-Chloroflexi-6]
MLNKNLLITFVLLMSGLVFGGIAGWMYYQQASLERSGITTEGLVVGLVESSDSDGTSYAPIIRFKTQSGREIEFQANHYSYPSQYEIGQTVSVLYPADKPTKATLKGEGKLLIIIFGIVGAIDILVGLFFGFKTFTTTLNGEA